MKKISPIYVLFYVAFLIVVGIAIFFDKYLLIFIKPIVPLSLIILYAKHFKKMSPLFPISMMVIIVTDIFVYIDFLKHFEIIAILIALFYLLCILMMGKFISKKDIKLKTMASPPAIIGLILIAYLIFSITELALPKLKESIGAMILIIVSVLFFVSVCFLIYLTDRYEKTIYLFTAACCTLFVDALLAINELYYYTRVFTALINIVEIAGLYFFASFFIETKPTNVKSNLDKYF